MAASLGDIVLHDEAFWVNDYAYSPISHNQSFTLSGRQVIQSFKKQASQEMIIDCRWITKETLDKLKGIEDDEIMMLTLPTGQVFNVIFDRKKQHIEAEPIERRLVPEPTDLYEVVINLITV